MNTSDETIDHIALGPGFRSESVEALLHAAAAYVHALSETAFIFSHKMTIVSFPAVLQPDKYQALTWKYN